MIAIFLKFRRIGLLSGLSVGRSLMILLPIILLFAYCQKTDLSEVSNLRSGEIAIIGHGGMGFQSPDVNLPANSFESITKAVENYQADGVEVDVQMSVDGTLYLYHDNRLQTLTDCLGCLYQWKDIELVDCQYVSGFAFQQNNNRGLVKLQAILERFGQLDPKPTIFLDLKTSPDCPNTFEYRDFEDQYIESLLSLIDQFDGEDWIIPESASLDLLRTLKERQPDLRLNYFSIIDEASVEIAVTEGFFGLSANFDGVKEGATKLAHESGISITLGIQRTRNDAIRMIEYSADFIYTDNIPLLQSILN
jgi:glycerophosphoryl diester phosphodiesterase